MQNNIRVFYKKVSRAKYISHLDITRCMQRALKRSGIPVWHTEGFNPHIYITFALPLSLGYESESESMDMRLNEDIPLDGVMEKLNEALPPDIIVTAVKPQVNKPDRIVSCLYTLTLTGENGEALQKTFLEFMEKEQINVEKKTKKGFKVIDIKPLCEIVSTTPNKNSLIILIMAAAGNETSINPTLLTDEFLKETELDGIFVAVMRNKVYMDDGKEFE